VNMSLLYTLACTLKKLDALVGPNHNQTNVSPLTDIHISLVLGKLVTMAELIEACNFDTDHISQDIRLVFNPDRRYLLGKGRKGGVGGWVYFAVYYWMSGPLDQRGYELVLEERHDMYSMDANAILRRILEFYA